MGSSGEAEMKFWKVTGPDYPYELWRLYALLAAVLLPVVIAFLVWRLT
jgi:hypothetical protein